MRRRTFLATAATALGVSLAGCAQPAASLRAFPAGDDELAERASVPTHDELEPVVRELVSNGSATVTEDERRPDTELVTRFEGRYYRFSSEVVDTEMRTSYSIEVDFDPGSTAGRSVELSELPEIDRDVLSGLLELRPDAPENDGADVGQYRTYSDADEATSQLVPDPAFELVVVDGETYGVEVGEPRETEFETYRYTTEEVAASTAEYAGQVRDEYLFTLAGLSDEERELLESAIEDGGVTQEDEATEAFRSLAGEIHSHEAFELTEDRASGWYSGQWVLEYEGAVYWVTVDHNDWNGE